MSGAYTFRVEHEDADTNFPTKCRYVSDKAHDVTPQENISLW